MRRPHGCSCKPRMLGDLIGAGLGSVDEKITEDRLSLNPLSPEEALRALLQVDPDAPPVEPEPESGEPEPERSEG
jgi:hypothetical protein